MATISGDGSDNAIRGTGRADDISGGAGNDTILGGGGDDVIQGGDVSLSATDLFLDWTDQGGDGTDISGGFTQDTGGIIVGVSFVNDGAGSSATVQTDQTFVDTGDPFDPNSGLGLVGGGGPDVWTATLDFSAAPGSGLSDAVENVSFRLQDVDAGGWQDIVTVLAFDADGNPVPVTLTPAGDDSVSGNTVTAAPGSATAATDPLGSVLVNIPGPVSQVQIIHENGGTATQLLLVTDVHFQATPIDDDVIDGGSGDDTIDGGFGDDSLEGGAGSDSLIGGSGNDTLAGESGADTLEGGAGNDQLDGGGSDDSLSGGQGNDLLDGANGDDILFGDAGADTLIGGSGNDTLDGGEGADNLQGGDGIDQITAQGGDFVDGGEGGNDSGDTLIVDDVERVEFDPLNPESGTVFFNDGTSATFVNIENLIVNGGPDGIVQGTNQGDLIDDGFVDTNLEQVDNDDGVLGTSGDQDVIEAGLGDDTVFAGQGDDTVLGGPDVLAAPAAENLSWIAQSDGADATGTFTQTTGLATLTVNVADEGALSGAVFESDPQFVDPGEPFDANSGLVLTGDGGANVATVSVSSDTPLQDVSFRLNDIDSGAWQDIVTINAFDADGNPVPVTLTASGNDTVLGNTVTAGGGGDAPTAANGSVLVSIAGPISSFEVIYNNGSTGGQLVYLTDVHFTAVQTDDDLVHGDQGSDSLVGAAGDDTLFGDQLALDPVTIPSGTGGTPTSFTFENQSPSAVELAQIDDTGTVVPVITVPAGASFTPGSTTQTNWVVLDPETGDILEAYLAPPDGSVQVFDSQAADTLAGGSGNDSLSGDFGNDSLLGEAGDDTLLGGTGDDTVFGGAGADSILGGAGADSLEGGAGADTIEGGDDADTILGGAGDVIDGGEGGDDNDALIINSFQVSIDFDPLNAENGTVTFDDGSTTTFSNIENIVLTCFTPGTKITTLQGRIPVEDLEIGHQVLTRDSGYQPIRWIGRRDLSASELERHPEFRPVLIRKDAIAPGVPDRDMRLSPQHRIVIDTLAAHYWLGQSEVLVKAKDMLHKPGITRDDVATQSYLHVMFDNHEIVLSDNMWTESFQPGDAIADAANASVFQELLSLFPELVDAGARANYIAARHSLTAHEARLVV